MMETAGQKSKNIFINERTVEKGAYPSEEEKADFPLMRTKVV